MVALHREGSPCCRFSRVREACGPVALHLSIRLWRQAPLWWVSLCKYLGGQQAEMPACAWFCAFGCAQVHHPPSVHLHHVCEVPVYTGGHPAIRASGPWELRDFEGGQPSRNMGLVGEAALEQLLSLTEHDQGAAAPARPSMEVQGSRHRVPCFGVWSRSTVQEQPGSVRSRKW